MTLAASFPGLAGCSTTEPIAPIQSELLFCDGVAERFRYTQAEIDMRTAAGFTANLAREYRVNLTFDRECASQETVKSN